jgi:hypothetical protein
MHGIPYFLIDTRRRAVSQQSEREGNEGGTDRCRTDDGPSPFLRSMRLGFEAVLHRESVALAEAIVLTPFALRPVEARVTAQADDVPGSDLFDLLLPYVRPDPFELCFRSALSACAHGSPVT